MWSSGVRKRVCWTFVSKECTQVYTRCVLMKSDIRPSSSTVYCQIHLSTNNNETNAYIISNNKQMTRLTNLEQLRIKVQIKIIKPQPPLRINPLQSLPPLLHNLHPHHRFHLRTTLKTRNRNLIPLFRHAIVKQRLQGCNESGSGRG